MGIYRVQHQIEALADLVELTSRRSEDRAPTMRNTDKARRAHRSLKPHGAHSRCTSCKFLSST